MTQRFHTLYTLGHSTRSLEEFLDLLRSVGTTTLADVRSMPGSRKYPHFNSDALEAALRTAGFEYCHLVSLGGRRKATLDPRVNGAWRNASFRAYADHMQSSEFAEGLNELLDLLREQTVTVMCAEAVPWRCHRSLIGDALLTHGVEVMDIFSRTSVRPHTLTSFAKVSNGDVTYPPTEPGP